MSSIPVRLMVWLLLWTATAGLSRAGVDTLKGTEEIEDGIIYSWADCNAEWGGEDCRRYNSGAITNLQVGINGAAKERRALVKLPGWDRVVPDSSTLLLYYKGGADTMERTIFLYPVTTQFFEGSEFDNNLGNYPDEDSGVTWYHAYLDEGDGDSVNWTNPGGDYITAVACTVTVSDTHYYEIGDFNRILNYWDTSGNDYGFILINENAFPANSSIKTFGTTEGDTVRDPIVLLFYPSEMTGRRRQIVMEHLRSD